MKKKLIYSSSTDAWEAWITRRSLLRHTTSLSTTLLIVLAMQLSTPDYSLSTIMIDRFANKFDIPDLINNISKLIPFVTKEPLPSIFNVDGELAFKIKLGFFSITYWLINSFYKSHDVFTDPVYIRDSVVDGKNAKPKFPLNLLDEVYLYPKLVGSNRIPNELCSKCGTTCPNRLGRTSEKKTDFWKKIFKSLPLSLVEENLKALQFCSKLFYIRSAFLLTAVSIIPIYLCVRFLEYILSIPIRYEISTLGMYFSLLIFFVYGLKKHFSIDKHNAEGFWKQFKESVDKIFRSDSFLDVCAKEVCGDNIFSPISLSTGIFKNKEYSFEKEELKTVLILVNFLNSIINRKLEFIVQDKWDKNEISRISLQRLINAISEFYEFIYKSTYKFNACLFIIDSGGEHLIPELSTHKNQEFLNRNTRFYKNNFSKGSISIVSKAWDLRSVQSSSEDIPTLKGVKENQCGSIIAMPILLEASVCNISNGLEIIDDPVFAVLCMTSESNIPFSGANEEMNKVILESFSIRIRYEYIRLLTPSLLEA